MIEATRNPIPVRYDLIVPEFLEAVAQLLHIGAVRYDIAMPSQWKQGLPEGKCPVNHIMDHLMAYQKGLPHDHLTDKGGHLAAIAVNAMFEYWFTLNPPAEADEPKPTTLILPEPPKNPYIEMLNKMGFKFGAASDAGAQ